MITASVVLYKTNLNLVQTIVECAHNSAIDILYVVDNTTPALLNQYVMSLSNKVIYIGGQGNVGFGAGHNLAIRKSINEGAAYHIILNPDIDFRKEVIRELHLFMEAHPDVGMVKPAIINADGNFLASAMMLPTPMFTFVHRFMSGSLAKKLTRKYELRDLNLEVVREVPNFSGSFMFVRNSVLSEVGVFDEKYFMYFEDFDLSRRIHKLKKIVYYPAVTITHAHAAEHRFNKRLLLAGLKSAIRYYNKWGWIIDRDRSKWNRLVWDNKSIVSNV